MSDPTARWPLHQGGALGCSAPDPVFGAVHRVSSGLPCFLGVSQAGQSSGARPCTGCAAASPRLGAEGRCRCGQTLLQAPCLALAAWLCCPQMGECVTGLAPPAWHHRLQPHRGAQPQTGTVPTQGWGVPCGDVLGGCSGVRMGVSPATVLWGLLQFGMGGPAVILQGLPQFGMGCPLQ